MKWDFRLYNVEHFFPFLWISASVNVVSILTPPKEIVGDWLYKSLLNHNHWNTFVPSIKPVWESWELVLNITRWGPVSINFLIWQILIQGSPTPSFTPCQRLRTLLTKLLSAKNFTSNQSYWEYSSFFLLLIKNRHLVGSCIWCNCTENLFPGNSTNCWLVGH